MKAPKIFLVLFACILIDRSLSPPFAFAEQSDTVQALKRKVVHFEAIDLGVYRCGLISEEAAPLLKELGVKTVINFDNQNERARAESNLLEHFGIYTVRIPWSGWDYPSQAVVKQFLTLMKNPELRPIVVHCKRGSERTGLAIALWRVDALGWTANRAYDEMKQYEYRKFLQGHLKKYLYQFAKDHGDKTAKLTNPFERIKTNVFYYFFQLRKLNPFLKRHEIIHPA